MNDNYQNICELFHLDVPSPLPDEQTEQIRKHFGAIPKALESYYRLCGGCEEMNATQDFLVTPDGRYGHYQLEKFNCPDYCVFYVENQCCSEWAVKKSDLNQDNPPVYVTHNEKEWFKVCDTVSQFLISQAYMQAVFSKEYSNEEFYEITKEQVRLLAENFTHADADSDLYLGVQFFQPYPDTVIMVLYNTEENFNLLYSSDSEEHFEEIDSIISEILGFETDEED